MAKIFFTWNLEFIIKVFSLFYLSIYILVGPVGFEPTTKGL